MMTPREVVRRTIRFGRPDRLVRSFPEPHGEDFAFANMTPNPDYRPRKSNATDEWGSQWVNIGVSDLGEVKEPALRSWDDWEKLSVPRIEDPRRWRDVAAARSNAGEKFLIGFGISLYERVHFVRGLDNTWMDIYDAPDKLRRLIDLLVDMNLYAVKKYEAARLDGYMWCDDWGLQDRLMISPDAWREIWKPRYARVYRAAHDAGLLTLLHSCGDITSILDDLVEAGLDVIQMDQQENMGLDSLGKRWGGRITFWCPVDIQNTMARGKPDEIRAYCRRMVDALGGPEGGFMPKWYPDPAGAGHTKEAVDAMCTEFLAISRERYGR